MINQHTTPQVATITSQDVMGAKSGVGLRWVLAVSLATMVVVTIVVVGVNIASHTVI